MKKVIYSILLNSFILSCDKKQTIEGNQSQSQTENEKQNILVELIEKQLYGNWVGSFDADVFDESKPFVHANKLNIKLNYIDANGTIKGKSIVSGNAREIEGLIDRNELEYKVEMKEPGDHKYDGKFIFKFNKTKDTITGRWIAFKSDIPVTQRIFTLTKKSFEYNPNYKLDYINPDQYNKKEKKEFYIDEDGKKQYYIETYYRMSSDLVYDTNSSTQKLTEKDVKNLRKLDLEILRNSIFARHGYTFKNKAVRQFFDFQEWYVPLSDDVGNDLTPLEKENITLLKRLEKYAEDHYDTFGR